MKNFTNFYQKHTALVSILIIILLTIFANSIYIFITNPDPILTRSGLPTVDTRTGAEYIGANASLSSSFIGNKNIFNSGNSIEPNDGMTKQALGKQASTQLFKGELPLWNNYQAVGSPLLGETQSAAVFPLTLLFGVSNGFLIFEMTLEALCGVGMYLFLRKFFAEKEAKLNNTIAITAGLLFATLGTYAMLPNACANPIAFLPWQMLGIALIFEVPALKFRDIFSRKNIIAMLIFAISVIFAMNSGFPEIAFIDLILVVIFALVLLAKTPKGKKNAKLASLALPTLVSILVSVPWLLEFFNSINNGFIGGHNGGFSALSLGNHAYTWLASFVPNVIGFSSANPTFGSIGGYFSVSVVVLAVFAIFDKRTKVWQKLLFGGWFIIGWARIIGLPGITEIIGHIPLVGSAAVYRYIQPSMSFAIITLAALGLNRIIHEKVSRKSVLIITSCAIVFYAIIVIGSRSVIREFISGSAFRTLWFIGFLGLSSLIAFVILLVARLDWRWKKLFFCVILVAEALITFMAWQMGAPNRSVKLDANAMQYIQENIGNSAFVSNFIIGNYGSYFDARQIDINDLPVPKLWCDYIDKTNRSVAPNSVGCLASTTQLTAKQISEDKKIGVKYLVIIKNSLPKQLTKSENLKLVYSDSSVQVYENSGYRQYLSGIGCKVSGSDFDNFVVDCNENSVLTRLELFYPGWHVKIDGKDVPIKEMDSLFQGVTISAGRHEIEFYYWPKFMNLAILFAVIGLITIMAGLGFIVIDEISRKMVK